MRPAGPKRRGPSLNNESLKFAARLYDLRHGWNGIRARGGVHLLADPMQSGA
jgi:hypothetical protein